MPLAVAVRVAVALTVMLVDPLAVYVNDAVFFDRVNLLLDPVADGDAVLMDALVVDVEVLVPEPLVAEPLEEVTVGESDGLLAVTDPEVVVLSEAVEDHVRLEERVPEKVSVLVDVVLSEMVLLRVALFVASVADSVLDGVLEEVAVGVMLSVALFVALCDNTHVGRSAASVQNNKALTTDNDIIF